MSKKYIIAGLLIVVALNCCDDRKDYFQGVNKKPGILIAKQLSTDFIKNITDSIKIGLEYDLSYKITDEENLPLIINKNFVGSSKDSTVISSSNNDILKIDGKTEGVLSLQIVVKDSYNLKDTANLNLFIFKNLPPVASFTVVPSKTLSPYGIDIDASASFDQDSKWGGKVVLYNYRVGNNYNDTTVLSKISYICSGVGQKTVYVSVRDNNGAWSAAVMQNITVLK